MIISFEIDTKILKLLSVSLNQLLLINLLYAKTSKTKLKEFIKHGLISLEEFNALIEEEVLTEDSEFNEYENIKLTAEFTKKYKELFKDDLFEEFFDIYPAYVIRPDGIKSYIRTNTKRAKAVYNQLVGNDTDKHRHFIKCLLYEVNDRELTGNMGYMKNIMNWLTQEGWTYTEARLAEDEEITTTGYGEDIL